MVETQLLSIALFALLIAVNIVLQPSFVSPVYFFQSGNHSTVDGFCWASLCHSGRFDRLVAGRDYQFGQCHRRCVAEHVGGVSGVVLGMGLAWAPGCSVAWLMGADCGLRLYAIVVATFIVIGGLALKVLPQAGDLARWLLPDLCGPVLGAVRCLAFTTIVGWVFWLARRPFGVHLLSVGAIAMEHSNRTAGHLDTCQISYYRRWLVRIGRLLHIGAGGG